MRESPATDEALVARCRRGDGAAWEILLDRYHDAGSRHLERMFNGNFELAADLMQEVWEDLVQELRRGEPRRFKALFWTVLKRRAIDELRRGGRRPPPTSPAPPGGDGDGDALLERLESADPGPEATVLHLAEAQRLQAALERLPEHYRVTLVARDVEGRSNRETAQVLVERGLLDGGGDPEKKAENYYYRGLKAMRQLLQ